MEEPQKMWLQLEQGDIDRSHSVNNDLFTLAEIEIAYMNAELQATDNAAYDPITNNDSHFPLSILRFLGIHKLSSELVVSAKEMVVDRMDELEFCLETSPNMPMIMVNGGRRFLRRILGDNSATNIIAEMLVMQNLHSMGMEMQ